MKILLRFLFLCCLTTGFVNAQTISGKLTKFPKQEIRLEGFNGLNTYTVSKTVINEKGEFEWFWVLSH